MMPTEILDYLRAGKIESGATAIATRAYMYSGSLPFSTSFLYPPRCALAAISFCTHFFHQWRHQVVRHTEDLGPWRCHRSAIARFNQPPCNEEPALVESLDPYVVPSFDGLHGS